MRSQSRVVVSLLLALIGLVLVSVVYVNMQSILSKSKEEADIYVRFAHLTQLNLKGLRGEYNIFQQDVNTYLLVRALIVNEGAEPIYYRSPILGIVRMKDSNGEEKTVDIHLSVENSTGAFYPSVTYKMVGLTLLDNNEYLPYRLDLLINGVAVSLDLYPVSWPRALPLYLCNSCELCEYLLNNVRGGTIFVIQDIVVDKNPCITFSGDGGGTVLDCGGHSFVGSGSETVFRFQDASNYYLRTCYVSGAHKAIEINNSSPTIRGVTVSDSAYAVYLHDPISPSSYSVDLQDIMYNSKKLFFFKPGYGSSFEPFQPLAVWVYGFSGGVSVSVSGELERVFPPLSIVGSTSAYLSDFSINTDDDYGVIILNSSDITISDANIDASSAFGIYVVGSSGILLNNVRVRGTSSTDLLLSGSDAELGDVEVG